MTCAQVIAASRPSRVRVTQVAGDQVVVVIRNPRLVADTLVGVVGSGERQTRIDVPVSRVVTVSTRRFSVLKTGALVGGILAGALVVLAIALPSSW